MFLCFEKDKNRRGSEKVQKIKLGWKRNTQKGKRSKKEELDLNLARNFKKDKKRLWKRANEF